MQRELNNIFGYYRLSVCERDCEKLLNVCMNNNFRYKNMYVSDDGRLYISCSVFIAWKLREVCEKCGIEVIEENHSGLFFFFSRYRKRYGIALGIAIMFGIIFYSYNLVWDIRIDGNQRLSRENITAVLKNCGLYEGMERSELLTDEIECRVMIECSDITWMAITTRGTVVNVQIREKEELPPKDTSTKPANLIASCDAQISALEIFRGNPMVSVGQVVKEGDLLVSGVYDSVSVGYRVTRSSGKVFAHTIREFDIEIPLQYEQKVYIDEILISKTLKIFEKEINIFKNSGNTGVFCDTIKSEKELAFYDGEELPVSIKDSYILIYEIVQKQRTEVEANELAQKKFSEYLAANFSEAELLDYSTKITVKENSLVMHCTVHAIENIAVMQEFDIEFK